LRAHASRNVLAALVRVGVRRAPCVPKVTWARVLPLHGSETHFGVDAMIKKVLGAVLLSACVATAGHAQTTLTFEGTTDGADIGGFYNGGAGGNLGVTFFGGYASYSGVGVCAGKGFGGFALQPSGCAAMLISPDVGAIAMNVDDGFVNNLSLYYTSPFSFGYVSLYGGADGNGTLLAQQILPKTPNSTDVAGCGASLYCPFVQWNVAFAGTAKSAVFSGDFNSIGFDDITFTSAVTVPVTTTPEPATYALMGLGLAVVGIASRRRRSI
jgi:hypothetical protein